MFRSQSSDPMKILRVETVAQAYLELLRDRGIDCFFANAGTDFASIVDAFARVAAEGKTAPRPIAVPHEFVAVSMAHGYYLVTGRPQVVMVHVTVGTANGAGAVINASRTQVPVLFTAGRTPITEEGGLPGARDTHIHWAQESFDQAGMLREYVKWDYELRHAGQLEAVVDRALELAMAEPRGTGLPHAAPRGAGPAARRADHRVAAAPAGGEPALPRSRADRGGGRAACPRAEPADRHRRGRSRAGGGGGPGRPRGRGRVPGARVEPRVRELPRGPPVPRGLGLREPGLPGDRRGRRRAGRRLRRALVPVALAAGRRRDRDPARRRPVLLPVPDALLSLRRPGGGRAGRGAPAPRGGGAAPRRPGRRGGAAGAARRRAPGPPRDLGPGGAGGRRPRTPIGFQWASRCVGEVLGPDTIVVNEYPLDLRHLPPFAPGACFGSPHSGGSAGGWAPRSGRSSARPTGPSSPPSGTAPTSSARRPRPTWRRGSTGCRS